MNVDLHELYQEHGQSIWLDYIRRHLLTSGELTRLVEAVSACATRA